MARGKPSKWNAQISEEAAEWFVEFRTGEPNAASREQFDAWVRSSPEHLRAYLEIAAIWNESHALSEADALRGSGVGDIPANAAPMNVVPINVMPMKVVEPPDGAKPTLITGTGEEIPPVHKSRPMRGTSANRWRAIVIAASLVAVFFCAGMVIWYQLDRAPQFATDFGEQRSVRLNDGSTVELNSRTQIRVHYSRAERRIEMLSGQALFHVAADHARPFIVANNFARIKAVGTRFDVNLKSKGTVVTVIEGRVAVSHDGELLLVAGEQVTLAPRATPRPTRTNTSAVTAWTQHQLVLDSEGLTEVAEEFNRYSARPLVVEDKGRTELRLSGVFSTDPDFLIRYLRERSDITIHETESEIRITRHD